MGEEGEFLPQTSRNIISFYEIHEAIPDGLLRCLGSNLGERTRKAETRKQKTPIPKTEPRRKKSAKRTSPGTVL